MAKRKDTYLGGGAYRGLYGGDARGIYNANGRRSSGMRIYSKPPRRWPKVLIAILVVLIIVACVWQFACGGLPFLRAETTSGNTQSLLTTVGHRISAMQKTYGLTDLDGNTKTGSDITVTVSAVGDCTFGRDPSFSRSGSFDEVYEDNGPSYFFENVSPYTSADQLTIANCEGALTESSDIVEKTYNFKGPAEYAQIFKDGSVEAVNLANNHSFDYGTKGYEDTKANLTAAGITNFGYDRTGTYEVNGVKIGLFGICELDDHERGMSLLKEDIDALKKQGCQLVIGVFHWGIEGDYVPDGTQVEMAHAAVDAGCDLVLGGHPHVLQGIEYYNQRYICYSLANFCFGGNTNPMDYRTMIFQQTFTFRNGQLVLGEDTRKNVRVVPCSVSSASGYNNYQPTPLTGDEGVAAIEKLNGYSGSLAGSGVELSESLDASGFANVK